MYKFILPALFLTSIANAQDTNQHQHKQPLTSKQWHPLKLKLPGEAVVTTMRKDSANKEKMKEMLIQSAAISKEWQGEFSHITSDGSSVYELPKDHMLCLVADKSKLEKISNETVQMLMNPEPIPNAFPQIQVIPRMGENH